MEAQWRDEEGGREGGDERKEQMTGRGAEEIVHVGTGSESGSRSVLETTRARSTRHSFRSAFTVGRSGRCDVVIDTTEETRTISKSHARIFTVEERGDSDRLRRRRWMLQDLDTLNGTAVNGMELVPGGTIELHDGDEVLVPATVRKGVRLLVHLANEASPKIVLDMFPMGSTPEPPHPWRANANLTTEAPEASTVSSSSSSRSHVSDPERIQSVRVLVAQNKRSRSSICGGGEHTPLKSRPGRLNEDPTTPRRSAKRARRTSDSAIDKERFMVCSVCLDFYQNAVTLACSHTFCGDCVSHWFRSSSSLSCPSCRSLVKHVPVRNRALDDLIHHLVGHSESYKAAQQSTPKPPTDAFDASCSRSGVFSRWGADSRISFSDFAAAQFSEQRLACCRAIGLSEDSIDRASAAELCVAAQNMLLDCANLHTSHDVRERLKIFLHFG